MTPSPELALLATGGNRSAKGGPAPPGGPPGPVPEAPLFASALAAESARTATAEGRQTHLRGSARPVLAGTQVNPTAASPAAASTTAPLAVEPRAAETGNATVTLAAGFRAAETGDTADTPVAAGPAAPAASEVQTTALVAVGANENADPASSTPAADVETLRGSPTAAPRGQAWVPDRTDTGESGAGEVTPGGATATAGEAAPDGAATGRATAATGGVATGGAVAGETATGGVVADGVAGGVVAQEATPAGASAATGRAARRVAPGGAAGGAVAAEAASAATGGAARGVALGGAATGRATAATGGVVAGRAIVGKAVAGESATGGTIASAAGLAAGSAPAPLAAATGATGEATSVPGVDLQQAVEALHGTIALAARQGLSQARIVLRPAELGEILVHLTQTARGLLARISTDSPTATQALADAHGELRQSLSSLGIDLARLDVGRSAPQGAGADSRGAAGGGAAHGEGAASGRRTAQADLEGPRSDAASATDVDTPSSSPPSRGTLVDVLA
jgi:Flagellar hook-length control protein FliK